MLLRAVAVAFLLTGWGAVSAQPLNFGPGSIGAPFSNASAELFAPNGAAPHPAMVVLHGCNGVGRHDRIWAQQLAEWGYLTLLIDSRS